MLWHFAVQHTALFISVSVSFTLWGMREDTVLSRHLPVSFLPSPGVRTRSAGLTVVWKSEIKCGIPGVPLEIEVLEFIYPY